MKQLSSFIAIALILGLGGSAIAQPPHWAKNCMRGWQQYKKLPAHKAFAMKKSATADRTHCGYAAKAPTVAIAEQTAIKACAHAACYVIDSQ
jgi:hypothetical protein